MSSEIHQLRWLAQASSHLASEEGTKPKSFAPQFSALPIIYQEMGWAPTQAQPKQHAVFLFSMHQHTNKHHSNSWERPGRPSAKINFTQILHAYSFQILKNSKTITLHYAETKVLKKPQESQESPFISIRTKLLNGQILRLACLLQILVGSINLLWKAYLHAAVGKSIKGFQMCLIMDWIFASVNIWLWWRQTVGELPALGFFKVPQASCSAGIKWCRAGEKCPAWGTGKPLVLSVTL